MLNYIYIYFTFIIYNINLRIVHKVYIHQDKNLHPGWGLTLEPINASTWPIDFLIPRTSEVCIAVTKLASVLHSLLSQSLVSNAGPKLLFNSKYINNLFLYWFYFSKTLNLLKKINKNNLTCWITTKDLFNTNSLFEQCFSSKARNMSTQTVSNDRQFR